MSQDRCEYRGEKLPCTCEVCEHTTLPRLCTICLGGKCLELRAALDTVLAALGKLSLHATNPEVQTPGFREEIHKAARVGQQALFGSGEDK